MPTTTPKPPPIPDSEVPVVDPATGKMTPDWYKYFVFWRRILAQMRLEIP